MAVGQSPFGQNAQPTSVGPSTHFPVRRSRWDFGLLAVDPGACPGVGCGVRVGLWCGTGARAAPRPQRADAR